MIKLDNIAVYEIVSEYSNPEVWNIVLARNIKTVQDLIDVMILYNKVDWTNIIKKIDKLKMDIEKYNNMGKEPVIFDVESYENKELEYTDTQNKCDILLLANPTVEFDSKYCGIKSMKISKLKTCLGLTKADGSNYVVSSVRNISLNNISELFNALDMYDEQVIRQSSLINFKKFNLFTYQQEDKKEIVTKMYAEIITYLLYNNKDLIWGKLSDRQKRLYMSSIIHDSKIDKIIKERVIANISNYTTLKELEEVQKHNYKVLNRFIKKG